MDADIPIPPALERLLAELEDPSPSIQEFMVDLRSDEFGGFFRDSWDESTLQEDGAQARMRLRVLRAIGNCTSLRAIHLNPSGKTYAKLCSVTEAEAGAFLQALQQSNHVLELLDVSYWEGFGSAAACVALAGLLRTSRTLTKLSLAAVLLTPAGLGHIAAALRAPHACSLQELRVSWNTLIGGAGDGAPHLADIITGTGTSTLRALAMHNIGMDRAGGEMIANALASNVSLEHLTIGWCATDTANQSARLTRILRALTPPAAQAGGLRDHSPIQTPRMPNVKTLFLLVDGDYNWSGRGPITAELEEALASMLRCNTCLQTLYTSTHFIGHGLEALIDSTSITALHLYHILWVDRLVDFTMLTSMLLGCKQLQPLGFWNDIPATVKREIFRALKHNPSIKRLEIKE